MAEPTKKSDEVESMITSLTGKDRRAIIEANECMTCDGEATEFRDEISRREYTISGMCQACQDKTFGC